jgi:hypothetical protein
MKRAISVLALVVCPYLLAEERTERGEKTFHTTAPGRLAIGNVTGPISVTASSGSDVRVSMVRIDRGRSAEDLALAEREVVLQSSQDANDVRLRVKYPCDCDGDCCTGRHERHYSVRYELRVEAPAGMALKLATVNDGDITVHGAFGDFEVNNVNGSIEMDGIAGSGNAHTVNGKVRVEFAKNPTGPTSFKSINGELRVTFQPGLSADVQLKTFNGEAWTDFDATALPSAGGHWTGRLYSRNRGTEVRIGNGGPQIGFDTLNGNIYILNSEKKS